MRRATCPTGGLPGRTSRPSWAAAAARAPGPWRPTTRTRRPSGSRRPGWPCARPPGPRPKSLWFATSRAGLPGQDERHRHRGGPAPARRRRRVRLRRRPALRHGLPDCGAARGRDAPSSSPPTCATGCRRAATSPPAATPVRPSLVGEGPDVLAEFVAAASATDEFTDRWRAPGDRTSKLWEERFGENRYLALGQDALARALKAAGLEAGDIGRLVVTGMHGRAVAGLAKKLGLGEAVVADDLALERGPERDGPPAPGAGRDAGVAGGGRARRPGTVVVAAAPGRRGRRRRVAHDRGAGRLAARRGPWPTQVAGGAPITYAKFLAWRGQLQPEPPRRPEPARVSSTAAHRNEEWKFGFVGSKDRSSGAVHLPPSRVSMAGGAVDDMEPVPWPTPSARSSPPPSTGWPTRRARPSCSPSSTSTAAAATRSS